RKLVAPLSGYANIAASVDDLDADNALMLSTDDPEQFRSLAVDTHDVRYVLVEGPLLDTLPRWRTWGLFDEALATSDGRIVILRLRPSAGLPANHSPSGP
ncbi:MAG: hypothetical protein ACYSUQ_09015, partial [Planctomycetota bacterium]